MALSPNVVVHLLDPFVLYWLSLSAGGLLEFEEKVVDPKWPTIKVPMLILLEDLARFVYGPLYLPE